MKTMDLNMEPKTLLKWAEFLDGVAHHVRLAIYNILMREEEHELKFKELQKRIGNETGRICNITPYTFHLDKMADAGIITIRGDLIRLEKRISVTVEDIERAGP